MEKGKDKYGVRSTRGGMYELIRIALTVGVHWYAITHLGSEPAFIFLEGMYIAFILGGACAEANRQLRIDEENEEVEDVLSDSENDQGDAD